MLFISSAIFQPRICMHLLIYARQMKIREIITKRYLWASIGKNIINMGMTKAGAYSSTPFTEPSQNSMHEGISPKGCICKDILEFSPSSRESWKMGGFLNTNASGFSNVVLGMKNFQAIKFRIVKIKTCKWGPINSLTWVCSKKQHQDL